MVKSAYIHIPFCSNKCNYCSFVSYTNLKSKDAYIDCLISEIKKSYKNELMETIYFGGGTPSKLTIDDFNRILKLFNLNDKTEITAEINPEDANENYFKALKEVGINRISIGIQTFDDKLLKAIGRRHTKDEAIKAVKSTQNAGFKNVSIDLIYGLPGQTLNDFSDTLDKALHLNIQHISLYGLKIEEGSKFYNTMPDSLPDNDEQAEMYLHAVQQLTKNGFEHYEISNFSKESFESKHNLTYWDNEQYYGFGAAASGYEDGTRYTNQSSIEHYIENPTLKASVMELSKENKIEEEIFLGFRKTEGIDTNRINEKFGVDFNKNYKKIIDKYVLSKHMETTKTGYKLTLEGLLLSNDILSEFIEI